MTDKVLDLDQPRGDRLPSSALKLPPADRDLDRSTPPIHLDKWAKMALTHFIFPEFKNSINCLGWYWGITGQAMWLASKRPKSGIISASQLMSSTTPKIMVLQRLSGHDLKYNIEYNLDSNQDLNLRLDICLFVWSGVWTWKNLLHTQKDVCTKITISRMFKLVYNFDHWMKMNSTHFHISYKFYQVIKQKKSTI